MNYANFVEARLAEALSEAADTISLSPAVAPHQLPPEEGGVLILADSLGKPSFVEIIRYAGRAGQVLSGVVRGIEGTTAREWVIGSYAYQSLTAGDFGAVMQAVQDEAQSRQLGDQLLAQSIQDITAADVGAEPADASIVKTTAVQTLTNKTITGYTETVYALAGTDIDPTNGTIQHKTLTANTTFTESLADGQSVTLMINPGTFTVTWPAATWIGAKASTAPTLVASVYNCIVLFQFGGVLYAKYEGRV